MSSRIWFRLSGMALLIGGLLTLVFVTILGQIKNGFSVAGSDRFGR